MFLCSEVEAKRGVVHDVATCKTYTYPELQDDVDVTASYFRAARKSLIFLFVRNEYASLKIYIAGVTAGHVVALLDDGMAEQFKRRLIGTYRPDYVVCSEHGAGLSLCDDHYHCDRRDGVYYWVNTAPVDDTIHEDVSLLLTTSGSTGSPKFVRLSRGNLEANAQSIRLALGLTPLDRTPTSLPFHYSFGLSIVNSYLLAGGLIVLTGASLLERSFWSTFNEHRCTSFSGVPYSYHLLERTGITSWNLPTLNTFTQAGGRLDAEAIKRYSAYMRTRGGRFIVMYGQTEATARIAVLPADLLAEKLGSVGKAIPGGELLISTDDNLHVKPHITGEVVYRGPNVMLGYAASRTDLSAGDLLRGELQTGDLGMFDDDRCLWITGRLKRCAKINGQRINLDEVEALVNEYVPGAAVSDDNRIFIFCETASTDQFNAWRRHLASALKLHHRLFEFRRMPSLPRTSNKKINYACLQEIAS